MIFAMSINQTYGYRTLMETMHRIYFFIHTTRQIGIWEHFVILSLTGTYPITLPVSVIFYAAASVCLPEIFSGRVNHRYCFTVLMMGTYGLEHLIITIKLNGVW